MGNALRCCSNFGDEVTIPMCPYRDIEVFVAGAVSHWHALGVDAWLWQLTRHKRVGGVVVILPHPTNGVLIKPSDFPVASKTPGVRFVSPATRGRTFARRFLDVLASTINRMQLAVRTRADRSPRRRISVVSPLAPNIDILVRFGGCMARREGLHPHFVLVDEGLGTYVSADVWRDVERAEGIHMSFLQRLLRRCVTMADNIIIAKSTFELRWLFRVDQQSGALILDHDIARDYRAVLRLASTNLPHDFRFCRPAAIFLSQPWSEYGQVSLAFELHVIKSVIERLKLAGFHVLIKPHPREDLSKFRLLCNDDLLAGVRVLSGLEPAEKLFQMLGPADIAVGYTSTGLLTASALFGIRTYSAAGLLVGAPDVGALLRKSCEEFLRLSRYLVINGLPT